MPAGGSRTGVFRHQALRPSRLTEAHKEVVQKPARVWLWDIGFQKQSS